MTEVEVVEFLTNNNWYYDHASDYYNLDISSVGISLRISCSNIAIHPDSVYKNAVDIMTKHGISIIGSLAATSTQTQPQPSYGMTVITPAYVKEFLKLNNWTLSNGVWNFNGNNNLNYAVSDIWVDNDPNGNFQWAKDRTPLPHVLPGSMAAINNLYFPSPVINSVPVLPAPSYTFSSGISLTPLKGYTSTQKDLMSLGLEPYGLSKSESECECGNKDGKSTHYTWCKVYKPFK